MDAYGSGPEARGGGDASKEPTSTGWLPVSPIISSELSEALGNQGSGTRIQYRDAEAENRNAVAQYLGSRLVFPSQAPETELQGLVYLPSPLFEAEQVEHYSIDRANFSAIDISNFKNSTLHQQVGFSSPSLFGSASSNRPSPEISPVSTTALSSGTLETLSTREETRLNEPVHVKRLRNGEPAGKILPSTACHSMPRQGVPSATQVSGSQTAKCVIQIHPEDPAVLSEPRGRVRARRGQATDPHSISERNRRVKISERLKTLQGLVPDANKTDKASMLDEIISHVELLQLQIFTMSKIGGGGTGVITPLIRDFYLEGTQNVGGANLNENGMGASCPQSDLDLVEKRVVQLLREDINAASEYLESNGLCLIPISKVRKLSNTVTDSQVTSEAIKDSFGTSVRKKK